MRKFKLLCLVLFVLCLSFAAFSACNDGRDLDSTPNSNSPTSSESYWESGISGDDEATESISGTQSESESEEISESKSDETSESNEESVHTHKFERIADERFLKSAATCEKRAEYYFSCECGEMGVQTFENGNLLPHTEVIDEAKNATCTTAGVSEGKHCSVCNKILEEQQVILALGHDIIFHDGKAATCTEAGYNEYESCTRCDYTTYEEISAFGHNYNDGVCNNCDDILDTDIKYFVFTALSDGTYSVSINKANIATLPKGVKIPIGYNGKRVVKIADRAFEDCKNLSMKIEIPEGIKEIGVSAFSGCSALIYIKIPDSVTVIGNSAFYQCSGLEGVKLPENLAEIGSAAFARCEGLTSVVIPANVKKIGEQSFSYCSNLTALIISDGIKEIGNRAFANCTKLADINIPNSIEYVDSEIFENSNNIKYNVYNNAYYIGNNLNKYIYLVKAKDKSISACTISEQTKFIGDRAFENCLNLSEIIIPDSVLIINDKAFNGCGELERISIGKNIQIIGTAVFDNCGDKLFEKKDNVVYVANWAVRPTVTALTSVSLRDGTRGVARRAFSGCEKLKSIAIPNSVVTIGYGAFSGCAIRNVYIPDGVIRIENYAFAASVFSADEPLYSVSIADSVEYIGDGAFNGKYLRYFSLGKNVKYLGSCVINSYNLEMITYNGTMDSWKRIEKASDWDGMTERYTVKCVDGNI